MKRRGLASTAVAIACATSMTTACVKTTVYGYQSVYQVSSTGEDPEPAPVEARQLLAGAKTVAFYPPDRCINTTDKAEVEKEFRANCGVLLSLLERAAERAGFEVVSWVNLRGSSRPIDYARDAKVDVLFEINEVASEPIGSSNAQRTLAFFDRTSSGDQPLNVGGGTAGRCHSWSVAHDKAPYLGDTATIDIKTVSVSDGRARWHYRKTLSRTSGEQAPKARFTGRTEPSKAGNVLGGIGLGTLLVGGIFWLVDEGVSNMADPVTGVTQDKVFGDAPIYMMIGGALLLTGGIVLMATQGQKKPTADEVLCLDDHVPPDGLYDATYAAGPSVQQSGGGSTHTFTEAGQSNDEVMKKKSREKAVEEIVQDFVDLLIQVKATARPPASTTTPPADGSAAPPPAPAPNP